MPNLFGLIRKRMGWAVLATILLLAPPAGWSQAQEPKKGLSSPQISGMYTFLREGEFVDVDVEPDGKVNGFVSRFGDRDSDRGAFLDHMFSKGTIDGNKLTFSTRSVHGVSYQFKGTVERGEAKIPGAEGYWVLKGTLTQVTEDQSHKSTAQQREVVLKSFPSDALLEPRKRD